MYIDYIRKLVNGKRICLFPMGIAAKSMADKLGSIGIQIDYFCDNNPDKYGSEYKGRKCITKEELKKNNEETVIIIESLYYKIIKTQLLNEGYKNIERIYFEKIAGEEYIEENRACFDDKVKKVKEILEDERSCEVYNRIISAYEEKEIDDNYFESIYENDQYYVKDIVEFKDDEVFVDLGAYIGDSAEAFIDKVDGRFDKMHLFELDPLIYKRLMQNVSHLYDKTKTGIIQCYPFGASDSSQKVFMSEGDSSSKIVNYSDNSSLIGEVRRLDQVLEGEKVTFIKADIEGAELSALKGMENIIKSQKPVLAICIYHSLSDTLNIPVWIKNTVPEYKIYVRHHTDMLLETVCYAVPI